MSAGLQKRLPYPAGNQFFLFLPFIPSPRITGSANPIKLQTQYSFKFKTQHTMKGILRFSSLFALLVLWATTAWAQPANDDCDQAFEVVYSPTEAGATLTAGDTRGATASTTPSNVCSGSWYTDDIWFYLNTPAVVPTNGIVVRVYFNNAVNPTDVPAIGMAIYNSCDVNEAPIACFSSDDPTMDRIELSGFCTEPNEDYYIRVWSTGATPDTEGTFEVGAYANETSVNPLWWETFEGGLEANGWTTEGTCAVADSNGNAGFKFLPDGLLDQGAYIFAGAGISSPSLCDGAVGVDSDYDDNFGVQGNFGGGPCPAPAQHFLVSPALFSGEWNVAGLSLSWNQAIRQFQSSYFFSYRTRDAGSDWNDWVDFEVNTEFETNGNFDNTNVQRHFMPGAAGHDSLQIRFVYNANYYMWGLDDIRIIETEANNMRAQSNWYAIAPWATVPENQLYPFAAMVDIYNAGASAQTNVAVRHTVVDDNSGETIYDATLPYGTIGPDSLAENKLFPELISLPAAAATYTARYEVSQDATDFDPSDNVINHAFAIGGNTFGLEDGFTRSVAVAGSIYDAGAPLSYAYGNYYYAREDAEVESIIWGVNNPDDMAGLTVQIYLLQWTDTNGDQIASSSERRFIGFADYTFQGDEGDNAILETVLENFEDPGAPVEMKAGFGYIAIIEYQASSAADPQFFLLASEDRNYSAQQFAMDSAVYYGLTDMPAYFSVLGFSPDGIIANIDYEVKELNVNDSRIFFGNDIVPLVRVVVKQTTKVTDLPADNLITVFPNPAVESIQVKLDFTKSFENVMMRLVDNSGRIVYQTIQANLPANHIERIVVKDLPAGAYNLLVSTADGQRTIPVVVIK